MQVLSIFSIFLKLKTIFYGKLNDMGLLNKARSLTLQSTGEIINNQKAEVRWIRMNIHPPLSLHLLLTPQLTNLRHWS